MKKKKKKIMIWINLRSDKIEALSYDKVELSLIIFYKERLIFFKAIANLFKNILVL